MNKSQKIKHPNNESAKVDDAKPVKPTVDDLAPLSLDECDDPIGEVSKTFQMMNKDGINPLDALLEPLVNVDDDDDDDDMLLGVSDWSDAVSNDSSIASTVYASNLSEEFNLSIMNDNVLGADMSEGVQHPGEAQMVLGVIGQLLTCIRRTEPDPYLVHQAEAIVNECHVLHHQGDRRYKNLNGSIFQRLIDLFDGPKFNDIFQRSQEYPSVSHVMTPPMSHLPYDPTVPSMLELAIAYGLHISRTANKDDDVQLLVRKGAEALNSMSNTERRMFWDFMVKAVKD